MLLHMLLGVDSSILAWKRIQSDGSFEDKTCETTMSLHEDVCTIELKGLLRKGSWFCLVFGVFGFIIFFLFPRSIA